jgi:hypothetical protein
MPRLAPKLARSRALCSGGVLLAVAILAGGARAQDNPQGPVAPPPTFQVHRIPSTPHPGPPPIPVEQIVAKFAANEDVAKKVYEDYRFQQTIRIEEDGGGKFTVAGEVYTRPDGQRYWRVTAPLVSTLKVTKYSLEDAQTMISFPLFFLTSDQITNYNFVYAGQQQLDQLNAYVIQVKPKMLSRTHRLFQGVVFVDDQDLAIVETFGKFVNELPNDDAKLPFSLFEAYRENFQGKYWLPTYVRSDDYIQNPGEDELHLWLIVHSTDFKPNSAPGGQAPSPAAADAPSVKP